MNILQRLGQWMAGNPEPAAAKTLTMPSWWSDVRSTSGIGQGGQFSADDFGLVGAVRSNVWAYNSVKARMTMVATPKLKLYKGEGDERVEIEKHPALDLLRYVNPINLNARSFLRGIEQQLAYFGRCVIHKNRGTTAPVELYILPKPYVEVLPDAKRYIGGYRWAPTGEIVDPKDIIDIFYPSADGGVDAESPSAVALGAINRYNVADRAQTAIDKRGGQKGGLVVHPEHEIDEDFERVKNEWDKRRADPDKAGSDMHVPHGTDYRGDAFSAVEMQREERINRLAKEIMAGYGIPPAAAGDYTDASVLANAAVQMKAAWDLFGLEELNFIAEGLTNGLLWPEYKDAAKGEYYFAFDTSTINALNEDVDARTNRAVVIYTSQLASLNEARELAGLDASEDPNADIVPVAAQAPTPEPAPIDPNAVDPNATPDMTAPADAPIQQQALNGAQISSLVEVVRAVSSGDLPAESAIEIIQVSFPGVDIDTVLTMVDAATADQVNQAGQGDPEIDALSTEVDSLLAEIDATAAKAVGRPEKGDRDGDGIFNEGKTPAGGAKVSPVTGRSLAPVGGTAEEKKAAKDKEKAMKKAESDRQKAIKKAESQRQREQKKAESAKQKEQKAAAKKQAQLDQLDAEGTKLQAAYDSIKDRADVDPKLKQKVIDTLAKIKAKRDSLATGQSEATSGILQDIARIPTKAEPQTGIMVALMLNQADAESLAAFVPATWDNVTPEPASNYHITLTYLGDTTQYDQTMQSKVAEVVARVASQTASPALVTIKGGGRFENPDGAALWAGVGVDGLARLQNQIAQGLLEAGVNVPRDHGDYRPHITLGYVPAGEPAFLPVVTPIKASFNAISLMWGGDRTDFLLGHEGNFVVSAKAEINVEPKTIPIIDPVGRMAVDEAGTELGVVTKVARFNVHGDITATAEDPVIYIGDKVFKASTVKVVLNG